MQRALSSYKRIIVSGDTLEYYLYKQPFFYNWMPGKQPIRDGEPGPKRTDNIQRATSTIRRLIQCNQEEQPEKPKFVTLTYAKEVKELEFSNPHFTEYQERFRESFGNLKYVAVPEFMPISQRVHYHVLYFNLPFVNNFKESMSRAWPHGSTKLEAVRSMKAMPRYIGKYMTKSLSDPRLRGRKSYFTSRNLLRPITIHDEEKCTDLLERHVGVLDKVAEREFQDFRGRDVRYMLFKGARDLTTNLRLVQSF